MNLPSGWAQDYSRSTMTEGEHRKTRSPFRQVEEHGTGAATATKKSSREEYAKRLTGNGNRREWEWNRDLRHHPHEESPRLPRGPSTIQKKGATGHVGRCIRCDIDDGRRYFIGPSHSS